MAEEQDELKILSEMHEALVDLLEKKGLITDKEYAAEVKHRLEESKGLTRFEELEE